MSSTKPKGWVTVKTNNTPSPNKRKRRRKRNKTTTHKPISTKPKHAAPANAATIYCQWFQDGLCHRGKNCFFIHELDPLSEKNPIEHRQMIKHLTLPKKSPNNSTIKIPLQKPKKPPQIINNNNDDNDDGFILPSQNISFQQTINKYNRYTDFTPTAYINDNTNTNPNPNPNPNPTLNANATEFIPQTNINGDYNPYLTAENAHSVNPYELSGDFVVSKLNVHHDILDNPEQFNQDDYEVWEDENGEIIVIEKDQLYGDDPYYHDQKMLKEFNELRINNNTHTITYNQKGIRSGGNTYNYGGYNNNNNNNNNNNKSFQVDENMNPDYDPNAKICHFWLNGTCAFNENCNMAHRFETNSCPHCDKYIGKSPLIQQQHLKQCNSKIALDSELKMSVAIECGICRENILLKGSKFGLLTGCIHTFCLKCIREWRGVLHQSKEVVRSCPICRKITWFIVPCNRFIMDKKRKENIINKYKKRLSEIKCKHFDENEECPFGTSCFYKHIRKDGSIDDKKVTLRHMINADGETEIMQQMRLSEFLFGNDD